LGFLEASRAYGGFYPKMGFWVVFTPPNIPAPIDRLIAPLKAAHCPLKLPERAKGKALSIGSPPVFTHRDRPQALRFLYHTGSCAEGSTPKFDIGRLQQAVAAADYGSFSQARCLFRSSELEDLLNAKLISSAERTT
jgi:hypothetical protein